MIIIIIININIFLIISIIIIIIGVIINIIITIITVSYLPYRIKITNIEILLFLNLYGDITTDQKEAKKTICNLVYCKEKENITLSETSKINWPLNYFDVVNWKMLTARNIINCHE